MADEQEPWTQIQIASFRGETQKVKQLAEQMSNPDPFFFEDPNAPNPQGILTQILREIKFGTFKSFKTAVFAILGALDFVKRVIFSLPKV